MFIASQNNIVFYNSRIEQERLALIALKKSGNYNLLDHLNQHPIAELARKGIKLPDNHPLMRLKSQKARINC